MYLLPLFSSWVILIQVYFSLSCLFHRYRHHCTFLAVTLLIQGTSLSTVVFPFAFSLCTYLWVPECRNYVLFIMVSSLPDMMPAHR